ncbi:MAG: YbjN domain-containing protein [Rhodobacter sp.]|uniref:YbjN domain-containing protein n=1 Tax=Pararhodobacter sp. TaxID=2127056 RepID=UPI001DCE4A8B|nr:YbjN domain-containing protein [Pararhodobacter sp.]MCB1346894.1 YbjN domain-containing protein [Paracoccaceae bacterium]MCC0074704.1 YbjN domain-containing protein [Rhodobacter sp.]HPD93928.1 YbjN domain-containing protein [Pararhodobacter sp.]
MPLVEDHLLTAEIHPIDIVETLAEFRAWDFDRVADDQIAMSVEGQWRSYSLTLAWSGADETLRLICTYDMEPPTDRMAEVYEILNLANDLVWSGGFTYWAQQNLMVWRYGLLLSGAQIAAPEQIDQMIQAAVAACERFYPAFQLVAWADRAPDEALKLAIAQAYGRA